MRRMGAVEAPESESGLNVPFGTFYFDLYLAMLIAISYDYPCA